MPHHLLFIGYRTTAIEAVVSVYTSFLVNAGIHQDRTAKAII